MTGAIVVAGNRLHTLAEAHHEHHAKATESVDETVGANSQVASIAEQLVVEQRHYSRCRQVHREWTQADHQDVFENV